MTKCTVLVITAVKKWSKFVIVHLACTIIVHKKPINVLGSKLNLFEAVRCLFFEYCCVVWCIHSVLSVCLKKIMEQPTARRVWLALGCFSSLHYCCWYKYYLNQGRIQEFLIGGGGGGGPHLPDHKVTITDNRNNSKVIIKGAGRVWNGIFGIPGNAKCLDGKRDLNATREAGFLKICTHVQDAGFFSLCVGNLGNHDDSNTRSGGKSDSSRRAFSCVSYQLSKQYTKWSG